MNIVVANRYAPMLQMLNIDIIKTITGEFEVEELVAKFKNFYFNKIVLDITAIKNCHNIQTIQRLSASLDMNKVILVLDDSDYANSKDFISNIISMGIYNFTKNNNSILQLLEKPNTYKDVAKYHQIGGITYGDDSTNEPDTNLIGTIPTKIVGFKNVTAHAGATSLVNLSKKILSKYYNVVTAEVGKDDFKYFKDSSLKSIPDDSIATFVATNSDKEIILIDLNENKEALGLCHEVIYLVEPTAIKLNQLLFIDEKKIYNLKDKKVVLNRSVFSPKEVADFEFETNIKVFCNLPNLDDRLEVQPELEEMLIKLDFVRIRKNM